MDKTMLKDSKGIKVLVASALGNEYDSKDFAEVAEYMAKLAENPTPENRYEIAQILALTVQEVSVTAEDWLNKIADTRKVGIGDKPKFKVDNNHIKAYIQAKGATTQRSRCTSKYFTVDTDEVSARPCINLYEMRSGKFDFADWIVKAAIAMNNAKIAKINAVLNTAFAANGALNGAYASGSGVVKATFDGLLHTAQRLGKANIIGDIAMVSKLSGIAGFNGSNETSGKMVDEINENGFIGKYLGANVAKINNPCEADSLTPIISIDKLYITTGHESPLKVVEEGDVYSVDMTNIDSDEYEVCLRQYFGVAAVVGNVPTIFGYEDTAV